MSLEVVTKMGAAVWEWGMLYKSVFHMVVLYGRNIWVIKGYMLKVLDEFHHWSDRRTAGKTARSTLGGEW